MMLFNGLLDYLLIARQAECEIALTAGSVWPLYCQVILFIVQKLS